MIRHTCPNCEESLSNSEVAAGMMISCPRCHHQLRVPDAPPAAETAPSTPPLPSSGEDMAAVMEEALERHQESQASSAFGKWAVPVLILIIIAGLAWLLAGHWL